MEIFAQDSSLSIKYKFFYKKTAEKMNCRRTTSEMKEFSPTVTFLIIYFEG